MELWRYPTGVTVTNSAGNSKTESNRPDNSMKCVSFPFSKKAHPLTKSLPTDTISLMQLGLVGLLEVGSLCLFFQHPTLAQITPDNTLGDENSIVTPNQTIRGAIADLIEGGAIRDSNLFHSFLEFNVGNGQRVYFANPDGITNILTRVTGSNLSQILGTLGVNGSANLFLLNPNGINFGANSRLDVAGSFVASTADSAVFDNGFNFSASDPNAPPLLTINIPTGLQYGSNPGPVNVTGASLGIETGQTMALLGGQVNLNSATLQVSGGRVELGGLSSPGTVALNGATSVSFPDGVQRGDVSLTNSSLVDVTNVNGGTIAINGANFDMSQSSLQAGLTSGASIPDAVAGNISINANGNTTLSDLSLIANDLLTGAIGNGGNIQLTTSALSITGGSRIQTVTNSNGGSGDIEIKANGAINISGFTEDGLFSGILTHSAVDTSGTGGNITINNAEGSLNLGNRGFIGTVTNSSSNAGAIALDLNTLVLETGGQIITLTSNIGNAGDITINATESVTISGESRDFVPNPFLDLDTFDLNDLEFITDPNPNVAESGPGGIPYVSIERTPEQIINGTTVLGAAENQVDYFSFSITTSNSRAIFDIDNGFTREDDSVDTKIFLFNQGTGELLEVNDDSQAADGAGGSRQVFDSFTLDSLIDTTITEPGVYLLGVGAFGSDASNNELIEGTSPQVGETYTLQVSLENQGTEGVSLPEDPFNPDNFNPNVEARSGLFSESTGTGDGGSLTINTDKLILNNGGRISTDTFDAGAGGQITLNVGSLLKVNGSTLISSNARGSGNAGTIVIDTKQLQVIGGTLKTDTFSSGNAGEITITATESVILSSTTVVEELGRIDSNARTGATGNGGMVLVDTPVFHLRDGAQINSLNRGDENRGGSITVRANELSAIGRSPDGIFPSGFFTATRGNGSGGNLTIETERLLVSDGAEFFSDTSEDGNAGNITVYASESVDVIGTDANGTVSSGLLTSAVNVDTTREATAGRGGDLVIETGRLRVAEGGRLQASAVGPGDAGNITIRARSVEVSDAFEDFTGLVSGVLVSVDEGATGNGGELRIDAEQLHIFDGGQVIASSLGDGQAGDIFLNVNDIEVTGISEDPQYRSRIAAFSEGNSAAGSVTITSNTLRVRDGAEISVSARVSGDNAQAGNLEITAESILLDQSATLSAEVSAGDKGNVNLDSQLILIRDRSNITTNATGTATGGNITIDTDLLVALEDSDITANAVNSFGGRVIINALSIFGTEFREQQTPNSDITASSERGASFSGTVEINAPYSDPSAVLFELPSTFVNPKLLVATGCGTDEGNQFTEFGRGGLPTDHTQPLVGETLWMDLRPLPRHTARRRKNPSSAASAANPGNSRRSRIIEANRWIVNKDGVVELVADSVQSSPFISWFSPYYCVR
ncbi:filamentous hemagglutinin N-terminal domain-containing protein [Moorena sp. SIO3H5]|uniref:two-partner secretion domain-containing protein n=1 Tax=Moorena sp. SIO3H5 TaxID=2607834 RepID=UPI0013BBC517|nr:filamentous hemagglutinin N-terminal domain-containing protein [Moorena sp. SIO3H5]NEO71347.1 filamentous hemagglutinin N-terminal domain-containing protein [Moorena sp. SIO3H5]